MANKTLALRKAITTILRGQCSRVFYNSADQASTFPYLVFSFASIDLGDMNRDDMALEVDVWDKGTDPKTADALADSVEGALNGVNAPQATILPTFFRSSRYIVREDDPLLQHTRLTFLIQNYER